MYSASGEKLRTQDGEGRQYVLTKTTDYAGNLVFVNGVLEKILFDGGYSSVSWNGSTPTFSDRYMISDHQGNNVMLLDAVGTALQVDHYNPYGESLSITDLGGVIGADVSPYKFGGKEWDSRSGSYDFGARQYIPSDIPRWTTMDPLAEKYYSLSPYAYCAGDPVNFVDPAGDTLVFAHGTSPGFKRRFNEATKYMRQHGTAEGIGVLQDSDHLYMIMEYGINAFEYNNKKYSTIKWNPYLVTEDDETYMYVSPVTQLAHEIGHATEFDYAIHNGKTREYFFNDIWGSDSVFDTINERIVITTIEQDAARKHGEIPPVWVTRTKHNNSPGHSFVVEGMSIIDIVEIVIGHNSMFQD